MITLLSQRFIILAVFAIVIINIYLLKFHNCQNEFNKQTVIHPFTAKFYNYDLKHETTESIKTTIDSSSPIYCFRVKADSVTQISDGKKPTGKSIFFIETSCNSHKSGKIVIKPRQACAVESAAKLNPNFQIYLLYLSPGNLKQEGTESDRILEALLSYNNINIRHVDYEEYLKDTVLENLYKENKVEKSSYATSHASDVLRYLTLWKYGGIYLDLDTITIKSLENLPLNFAGVESDQFVASAVLSFGSSGSGHKLVTRCLEDLRRNFNGQEWTQNGPGVITRLSEEVCNTSHILEMPKTFCSDNYTVYPVEAFCPIPFAEWEKYFRPEYNREVKSIIKNSYVLHMWNKLSSEFKISVNSTSSYISFARKTCPKVFNECKTFF